MALKFKTGDIVYFFIPKTYNRLQGRIVEYIGDSKYSIEYYSKAAGFFKTVSISVERIQFSERQPEIYSDGLDNWV